MAKPERRKGSKDFKERKEFDQRVVDVARVTRVVKGGKRFRFRATVVIGNRKGKVGYAIGKGNDVRTAVDKAAEHAKKNLVQIPLKGSTIPYEVRVKFGGAKIVMKPAAKGRGVIAGGAVRLVMDLAGIRDVSAKMLGSKNKPNNVRAVFAALEQLQVLKDKHYKIPQKKVKKIKNNMNSVNNEKPRTENKEKAQKEEPKKG